jgi:hypothetical protein
MVRSSTLRRRRPAGAVSRRVAPRTAREASVSAISTTRISARAVISGRSSISFGSISMTTSRRLPSLGRSGGRAGHSSHTDDPAAQANARIGLERDDGALARVNPVQVGLST